MVRQALVEQLSLTKRDDACTKSPLNHERRDLIGVSLVIVLCFLLQPLAKKSATIRASFALQALIPLGVKP